MTMATNERKSVRHYMRALHRDLGFFTIGLVIVYSLSGIVLIYRDVDFLKVEKLVEKQLGPNLDQNKIAELLHVRNLKIVRTNGDTLFFETGQYNKLSGSVNYTIKEAIFPINKFHNLHTASSKNPLFWLTTLFGIILLFLAISSLWMFKQGTNLFKRGIYLTLAGAVLTIVILLI